MWQIKSTEFWARACEILQNEYQTKLRSSHWAFSCLNGLVRLAGKYIIILEISDEAKG